MREKFVQNLRELDELAQIEGGSANNSACRTTINNGLKKAAKWRAEAIHREFVEAATLDGAL